MEATHSVLVVLAMLLALIGAGWWMAAVMLGLSRGPALHWSVFCALGQLAALFGMFESSPRDAWSVGASNLLVLAAFVAAGRGVGLFLGRPAPLWMDSVAFGALVLVTAADMLVGLNPLWRAAMVSACTAAVLLRAFLANGRPLLAEFGAAVTTVVSMPFLLAAGLFVWRLVRMVAFPPQEGELLMTANTSVNLVALFALTGLAVLLNMSLAYMVLVRLVRRLQHLSRHDSLTGLMNRRAMMGTIDAELGRVRRGAPGWALLLVDVDHFKRVNDTLGHAAGDEALRRVATALRQSARQIDTVARMGGEEFCVLAPMTDLHGAALLAERLRQAVATATGAAPGGARVTVSVGVALSLAGQADTGESALARADRCLYRAKAAGRDRVELPAAE